ncbi:glycine zipper 2TM domain-containing protein [Paracoccus sp. (in: a-proteobacteria)]|uniref:glycine zipper 2TM domain-containing protein n=1 Tax=Paracoccus sp. TaxID=267 RepID=UPI00322019AD
MIKTAIISLGVLVALAGCNPTPQQQAAMRCGAGTAGGAAVGAGLGSLVGGGSGRTIATAAGGVGGAVVGHNMAC